MNAGHKLAVLIVEDGIPQQNRLEKIVVDAAKEADLSDPIIKISSFAREALEDVRNGFAPNLIILDHGLAGPEDGVFFLAGLIADSNCSCRVIVLSGRLMQHGAKEDEIWAAYRALMEAAKDAGSLIQVELCEKKTLHTAKARIRQAVSEFKAPASKDHDLRWLALKDIVAQSPTMAEIIASIRRFLEQWQVGENNLLVLYGNRGSGKRFLALRICDAAGFDGINGLFEAEGKEWKTAGTLESALRTMKKTFTGQSGPLAYDISRGTKPWSHIIPDIAYSQQNQRNFDQLVGLIVDHPKNLFIWLCEMECWATLGPRLKERLDKVMTAVRVPCLAEREADVPLLAHQLLDEISPKKRISLGETAISALRRSPPTSVSALRTALRVAVNRLPADGTQLTAGDLPISSSISLAVCERPERPKEIPAETEARVIQFLNEQRNSLLQPPSNPKRRIVAFGHRFENEYSDIDKKVIRAAAYASAAKVWKGYAKNPSAYPTIFAGKKWAAVIKRAASRPPITDFAERHESYLLWLVATHGPTQPTPS